MNLVLSRTPLLATLALAVCAWLASVQETFAQVIVRCPQSSLSLLSNNILADAAYLRAQGSFLVSASIARNLNAEAASKEMDNAVKWVNTYFERRRLNREARDAEHIDYLEHLEKGREQQRRIIDENLEALGSDLSDELNFMLRELADYTSYSTFISGSVLDSPDNAPLSDDEKARIFVNEGKRVGGKTRRFAVDTAEELATDCWPSALRGEPFAGARSEFEKARDAIKRTMNPANEARLMKAVDQLSDVLNAAFPRERRKGLSPDDFFAYLAAKRYVQSLALSTFRLIETQRPLAADESFCFNGKTVGELLGHMMGKGLEFDKHGPGGEGTYHKLYDTVRAFYKRLVVDSK
ncbi:MAG TPA: hypothetical protein VND64_02295 [Pirellulales bacterium]|nr:hypothetical protein [Pirellulales bacterium]